MGPVQSSMSGTDPESPGSVNSNAGFVIGIVISCILGIAILVLIFLCCCRSKDDEDEFIDEELHPDPEEPLEPRFASLNTEADLYGTVSTMGKESFTIETPDEGETQYCDEGQPVPGPTYHAPENHDEVRIS